MKLSRTIKGVKIEVESPADKKNKKRVMKKLSKELDEKINELKTNQTEKVV